MSEKQSEAVKQIQTRAAHGAGWAIALGLTARVLSLVGSIVLTHLLDPEVMGEVGVAVIVAMTVNTFSTVGYGHFILAKAEEGRRAIWHIFVMHVALGAIALGVMLLLNQPLAIWMKAPALPRYLPWLALMVVLERLTFVPERVNIRNLRFKHVAATRSAAELTFMATALTLVVLGYGGFSIIVANVVRSGLKCAVFATSAPREEWLSPQKLSLAKYKEILHFGTPLAVSGWVGYASSRWDNLIVSMLYGPALMGQYNVAYNLAEVPADQIGEQAAEVLLPSIARIKREERAAVVLFSAGMLSFLVFPVSIGLGLVATTAAAAFIGPHWSLVGRMMTLLCVLSIARPLSHQAGAYMLANGRPRVMLALEIGKLATLVSLLFTLGRLSPLWACVAVGVSFIAHTLVAQYMTARSEGFPMSRWFGKTLRPLLACVPLIGGVLGVRWLLAGVHLPKGVDLGAEVIAGAIGYVVGALTIARRQTHEFIDLVKSARRRKKAPAPDADDGATPASA